MKQQLTAPNSSSQYTDEQRREVLSHYAVLGNTVKVAELTGIPRGTIQGWKGSSSWWVEELSKIKHEKQEEIDANLTRIIHKATESLENRIDQGDAFVKKDGDLGLKPITGRDLATITGIIFDKRQILRNLPTSIKSESTSARLNQLAEKVRELQAGSVLIEQD